MHKHWRGHAYQYIILIYLVFMNLNGLTNDHEGGQLIIWGGQPFICVGHGATMCTGDPLEPPQLHAPVMPKLGILGCVPTTKYNWPRRRNYTRRRLE